MRRSTLSDANKKRTSQFFGDVYKALYERYSAVLSDSKASKALLKGLYILDSTTISLFSQILKGVGRTPKNSKKKGGIKAHTLLEASCVLPSFVDYSAAAIHDHSRMSSILSLECLFKRLKQNFPLKYFLGDSVNAIEIQIWSVMIAYLLTRVISREAKDKMSFSNLVCAIRLTMFSYIDIVAMVVDPLRDWRDLKEAQRKQALTYNPKYIQSSLFDDL